ncbi:MAG: hypothetical protein HWN81_02320 [Candidatus Lokiarchaeota archaeon]|nr:hypothetical protein [Candidatus Lokiarchaeota archaeon]
MTKKKKKKKRKIIIRYSLHRLVWDVDRKEYNRKVWYIDQIRKLYDFENRNNI